MWYIWKARNDKFLSNINWSPMDILEIARKESEWYLTNCLENAITEVMHSDRSLYLNTTTFIYFVEESWKEDESNSGVDWFWNFKMVQHTF